MARDEATERDTEGAPQSRSTARAYAEAIATAVVLAICIRGCVVQAFKIPSGSMVPSLQAGDHLLVSRLHYGLRLPVVGGWLLMYRSPLPGDVIVFKYPIDGSKDFIKRVIAIENEIVEIRDKHVLVGGRPRDAAETYFADGIDHVQPHGPRDNYGPVRVPPRHVFVMGDNRDRSYDSRFWGFVSVDNIEGKALFLYWSWDGRDRWVRWERIGDLVHWRPVGEG
ncbi:MAG: signal peptidase I [Acidobacteria bacterium RBG_16_68_9]|nr:MAG: signal peptidase I [Acidobacteria bacterium RBG_16_68_9]